MLKIEFDPSNTALAAAIGRALTEYAGGNTTKNAATATASAGETAKTNAVSTATVQENPTNHAAEETVAGVAEQAGSAATTAHAGAGSAGNNTLKNEPAADLDEKGVAKNEQFCATAKDPYYGSGKKKGQWKKRQGVDEAAYDAWYAGELAKVPHTEPEADEPEVDTSTVFGGNQVQADNVPQDGGAFMTWVSEQQNAGKITQADLDNAYVTTGVQVGHLFGPLAKESIAALYATLVHGADSPQASQALNALLPM